MYLGTKNGNDLHIEAFNGETLRGEPALKRPDGATVVLQSSFFGNYGYYVNSLDGCQVDDRLVYFAGGAIAGGTILDTLAQLDMERGCAIASIFRNFGGLL